MFFNKKEKERRSIDEILAQNTDDSVFDSDENDGIVDEQEFIVEDLTLNRALNKEKKKKDGSLDKIIDDLDFDPAVYYGWGDGKMDNRMRKLTDFWKGFASIVWFLFGSLTFAPVLFTAGKIDQFFNDKKKSFWTSAIMYSVAMAILIYIMFIKK